ncbi:MAG: hypothetical protein QXO46_08285 [Nitrososphaerota archaeon]
MEVRIGPITEGIKIDDRGNLIRTRVVIFYIGNDGPFTIEIPQNEFSPEIVQAKIEEEKRKILQIRSIK